VADPKAFRSGRDFSAWIGLVPEQNSSGGKDKLGGISKSKRLSARHWPNQGAPAFARSRLGLGSIRVRSSGSAALSTAQASP
jgi:transposase